MKNNKVCDCIYCKKLNDDWNKNPIHNPKIEKPVYVVDGLLQVLLEIDADESNALKMNFKGEKWVNPKLANFIRALLASSQDSFRRKVEKPFISINKKIRGGNPCFINTRIPVGYVLDHLKQGYTVKDIKKLFPEVSNYFIEEL
jgi:uncharacterized protein (DUF433 family)